MTNRFNITTTYRLIMLIFMLVVSCAVMFHVSVAYAGKFITFCWVCFGLWRYVSVHAIMVLIWLVAPCTLIINHMCLLAYSVSVAVC